MVMSALAGVLFVVRLFRVDATTRKESRLVLIVAGMVISTVLATLGTQGTVIGPSEAWNLAYGLIPVCLALGLVSWSTAEEGS